MKPLLIRCYKRKAFPHQDAMVFPSWQFVGKYKKETTGHTGKAAPIGTTGLKVQVNKWIENKRTLHK